MNISSPVALALSKTLSLCAFELRHNRFDTVSFMRSLSAARYQAGSERKYIKGSRATLIILDRCEVLYFRTAYAFSASEKFPQERCKIYTGARAIAIRSLTLSEKLFTENGRRNLKFKADKIFYDAEHFAVHSRAYRFGAIGRYGSISKALPEIEFACSCDEVLKKSIRLVNSYFSLM